MDKQTQGKVVSEGYDEKKSQTTGRGTHVASYILKPAELVDNLDRFSPLRSLIILIGGIFLAEIAAMVIVFAIGPMPYQYITLLDASIMTVFIFPMVYFLSLRPLITHITRLRQTERALLRSTELQERFFDSIDTLIAYMDRDFNFIRVNEAYAKSDGHKPEHFIGKNHFELYPHPENQAIFEQVVETGEAYFVHDKAFEYPEYPERGVTYWNWALHPVMGDEGAVDGLVLSLVDVTERKRAEEKNRQLSRIVEQTTDTVVVTDREGAIEYVNPAFEQMTGYSKEEVLGQTPRVLKSGVHSEGFYKDLWNTILGGEAFLDEIANLKKNGELFYEVKTITPLRDAQGDTTHFVATGKDITERKRAEEELRKAYDELELRVQERTEELRIANSELEEEIIVRKKAEETIKQSEEKYHSLFSNMSEGFGLHEIILDEDGKPCDYRFLELNAAFERLTGMSHNDILGKTVKEVLPEIDPHWIETYGRVALTGKPVHYENFSTPLGKWYESYCYSPGKNQFAVVFFDVTERKQAEEALRRSQVDLDRAQEVGQIGSWRLDVRRNVLTWSDENHRIFGVPKGTPLSYETFVESVHPDDRQYVDARWKAGLAGEPYDIEHRIVVDGQVKWVREKAYLEIDDAGQLQGGFGITQDISERKRAEEALQRAHDELELRVQERTKELAVANQKLLFEIYEREEVERQLRIQTTAMEAAANGILITDHDGEILWMNPAITHMTGFTEEDLIGQNMRFFRSGQHDQSYYQHMWKTILAGEVWQGETTNRRKDSSTYIEKQTITPVLDENDQIAYFIAIKHDITEQKLVEAALELERTRLKNILDTIPDGVYIISQGYDIEYVNPVIEREFGAVNEQKCYAYFHDRMEPCPWCKNEEVFMGNLLAGEHTYAKNNKSYEIFDAPMLNSDGSVSKLKLLHDVTQRRKMELDLERSNLDLQTASNAERKQRKLAEALVEAALVLNKSLELDEVLKIILEQIRQVIPYQFANIGLLEGETFYDASHQGDANLPSSQLGIMNRYLLGDFPLLKKMCQTGQPVLISDTGQEPDWSILESFEWCRSVLSAPLIVDKRVIGFVNLFASQAAFFTQETRDRLVAFASHAAAAIQNAWLFEQVRSSSERLQSLSRRLVEIQENERLYIARELHDEAGQVLTSLLVDLRLLEKEASDPGAILKIVSEMESSLNMVIENLHRVAMALRPASLDHVGLVAALRQHVESVGERHGLQASFRSKDFQTRLPANVETILYRIVQESLTNVVRHAQASRVDVVLTVRGDKLVLIVEDDGIGFHPDSVMTGDHLGLFGLRERAEMIDANLVIESTPGKGTTIIVEVDYDDPSIGR